MLSFVVLAMMSLISFLLLDSMVSRYVDSHIFAQLIELIKLELLFIRGVFSCF